MDNKNELKKTIVEIINDSETMTTEKLINLINYEVKIPKKEIIKYFIELNDENKISFILDEINKPKTFYAFLFNRSVQWFWVVISLSLISIISLYVISDYGSFMFIRFFYNLVYLFFIPGYALSKYIFPDKNSDLVETVLNSMSLSIIISSVIGLFLYSTNIEINLFTITVGIFSVTLIFSILSIFKQFRL